MAYKVLIDTWNLRSELSGEARDNDGKFGLDIVNGFDNEDDARQWMDMFATQMMRVVVAEQEKLRKTAKVLRSGQRPKYDTPLLKSVGEDLSQKMRNTAVRIETVGLNCRLVQFVDYKGTVLVGRLDVVETSEDETAKNKPKKRNLLERLLGRVFVRGKKKDNCG